MEAIGNTEPAASVEFRPELYDWLKEYKWVWFWVLIRKAVIPVSGKSPRSAGAKKQGKSILEKRAQKKAKAESSESLFAKPRKNQR